MNTTVISALVPAIWQKELHKDVSDGLYFAQKKQMGKDTNNVIQVKDELTKQQGDRVTFGLSIKLSGEGVDGDNDLEGQEEEQTQYSQSVVIDQKRFAVKLKGQLTEQKAAYDMRMDAKEKLGIKMMEFEERQFFMKLGGVTTTTLTDVGATVYSRSATWSNSANIVPAADEAAGAGTRYLCAKSTGIDAIAATDILTTTLITQARVKAAVTSSGIPKIQPLRIDGQEYYIMYIHPWQEADLKTASGSVWAQAQRDAQIRGDKNPLFTGALGIWDRVILFDHEYVPTAAATHAFSPGATACNARVFRSLLCGRQAAVFAQCKNPNGFVEETFDYKNKVAYATGLIGGIQKTAFNSVDYGVLTVDTGATVIA